MSRQQKPSSSDEELWKMRMSFTLVLAVDCVLMSDEELWKMRMSFTLVLN